MRLPVCLQASRAWSCSSNNHKHSLSLSHSHREERNIGRNTCFRSACKKVASCTSLKDCTSKWIVQNLVVLFYHGMY